MKINYQVILCLSAGAVFILLVVFMRLESTNTRKEQFTKFNPITSTNLITFGTFETQQTTPVISSALNGTKPLLSSKVNTTMLESSLNKKGYTLSDLPPWSSLWTDKIHLCVMFNLNGIKPKKDNTDILVSYYIPFFRNITFIFDGANRKRPDFLPEFVDFITCDSHVGWYQHKCIRSCMHQGTEETQGYLYIADDMFINLTMMADLPTEKVWFGKSGEVSYTWILDPGPKGWGWYWWGPPTNNYKRLKEVIDQMPSEWMEQLKKTGGFPDHFKIIATSDIIYVPRKLSPKLTTAIDFIVKKTNLFCEIATSLALNIATPNNISFLNSGYLWGNDRSIAGIERTAKTAHFVHPVKLGVEQQRKLWIQFMENQLFSIIF